MFRLWVSRQDWDSILLGVPESHDSNVRTYLAQTHYLVVGLLHIVKRYPMGEIEGLNGKLTGAKSLIVAQRFVAVSRVIKKTRKFVAIAATVLVFIGGLGLGLLVAN